MAILTLSQADAALKKYYLDAVKEQIDTQAGPFFTAIEKSTNDVYGKNVVKLVRPGINGGMAACAEDGDLPVADANKYIEFTTPLKNLYGTIEITDKAIRASKDNSGAVVNLLNAEMESLVKSANYNFSRMLFGDGKGTLATVSSATNSVVTVDSARNLEQGMIIDFNVSGEDGYNNLKITDVDKEKNTFSVFGKTFDSTKVSKAKITLHNTKDELTGLEAIFATSGSLYGVSKSNKYMVPYIQTNVGAITEAKIQETIDAIEMRSGSRINMILCSFDTRRAVKKALSANNVMMPALELQGGYKAISYNGIPVVADRFCPAGYIYFLNTDDFELHQLCDWEWLQGENGEILKQVPGKAVYTATLVKYAELMCTRPGGQGLLKGVTG